MRSADHEGTLDVTGGALQLCPVLSWHAGRLPVNGDSKLQLENRRKGKFRLLWSHMLWSKLQLVPTLINTLHQNMCRASLSMQLLQVAV